MRYVLIIICCYTQCLLAQPEFRTLNLYTTQNGLSNNTISCIRQDSRGFLWIGTKEGLNRFDGFQFKRFFAAKDPLKGLPGNTILDILEYQVGQLLIATANGLSVYNTLSNSFENEKIKKPELKSGSGTVISSFYKDKDGNIWISHSGELDILDSNLNFVKRFTDLPWAQSINSVIIRRDGWFTDKQNRLWLASDTSGIQIIDFGHHSILNSNNNPHQFEFLKTGVVRSIFFDEVNNILLYAPWGSGLYKYDFNTHRVQKQDFGYSTVDEWQSVNKIIDIGSDKVLCITANGCYTVDAGLLTYEKLPVQTPGPAIQTSFSLLTLLIATNDNYWIGTSAGLFQMERQQDSPTRIDFTKNGKKMPWSECNTILRSSTGELYVSNYSHVLLEVKKDLQGFSSYIPGDKQDIVCMKQDQEDKLSIGTSAGFYQFDRVTKKNYQPQWLHPDLFSSRINAIHHDEENNTWIATRYPFGIYRYNALTNKTEKINNAVTAYFEKSGSLNRVSQITEDKKHIWMISRLGGGIICYEKSSGEWSLFPKKEKLKNLLSKGMGYVFAGANNNLWLFDLFGTGLIKYNYALDSVSLVTRNDGLPSDFIQSICTDGSDNLWILTEYGISRFDIKSEKIVFNDLLKLKTAHPVEFISYDTVTKSIIAASNNQLSFYPVEKFQQAKKESLLPLVDKVWVNSKEVNTDVNGQSLKLKPGQTNISIDFTTVHYSNADKIKFAYQLAGADHDWKYADVNRSAQYAVLTPGKYTFKIKVADENGNWSEAYDSFSFTIVPHFWQTNLFKIAIGLFLVAGCWLLVRRRIKNIRYEAEMKKQVAETEMMALRAQMNPHFIFNCLNSIDNLIQSNEKEKATSYLARFAKLIRAILENSKHQLIPVWKDMETLKLYLELETLRFDHKFNYQLDIAEELQQGDYKIPPLLIQPYVENAIHHGLMNKINDNRNLLIKAAPQNGEIKFTIEDNGIGRQQSEKIKELNKGQHLSLGQLITENRIKLYNNGMNESVKITDLVNSKNEAAGTRVEITLENK